METKDILKYKDKSISQLIKIATKYFNSYIRLRDSEGGYFKCISCAKPKNIDMMHAGHYLSAGHNGIIRFNEDNVNGQCLSCNLYKHGDQANYRINLVKKIGLERVEILESLSRMSHKWDRNGLINIIIKYKELCK